MDVSTDTQLKKNVCGNQNGSLLDLFLLNSKSLGHDSLKVDRNLFLEAASKPNVEFEFIRLKSFELNKASLNRGDSKNAILEAEFGIADSGKLLVDTEDSDVLINLLLAESLHIILPSSKILYSMTEHELVNGRPAVELFRGIASHTATSYNNELCFSTNKLQTIVYIIEDL